MELGLSLGGESSTTSRPFGFLKKKTNSPERQGNITNISSSNTTKNGGLGFCMALGIGSNNVVQQESDYDNNPEKSQENGDKHGDGDGDDEDDEDDDQRTTSLETTPVQLNLLPLAPVPRQTPWSSDDGSSDNGSSGNMGLPAARGFDVNRLPGAGEKVSSANSVGSPSPFPMDFSIFRSSTSGNNHNISGINKRDLVEAALVGGNDVVEADRAGSRASDEDENGSNTRKKLRLSKEQSAFLEESFKEHNTLNPKQKLALAKQLNLRPRQVEVWFQNRRARTKLKQTEVDCEYLKRCCETLTEENRRLHKELQELRALKTSTPFYMQLPATTLTMCPSCERVATTTTAPASTTIPTTSTATAATATMAPTAKTTTSIITDSSTTKAAAPLFPLSTRPRFFPFSPTTPSHSHQSAAS